MVEQNYSTEEVVVAAERTDPLPHDSNRYMRQLEDARQRALSPMTSNGVIVSTKIPRLVSAKSAGANRNGTGLPPLDSRFDRPYIRMLDNVSAISLDEFWNKSGKSFDNKLVAIDPLYLHFIIYYSAFFIEKGTKVQLHQIR